MNETTHSLVPRLIGFLGRTLALLFWLMLAAVLWMAWPFLYPYLLSLAPSPQQISKTVFYPAYLMMQEAPKSLPVPVAGISAHQLSNSWGAPRGQGRKHEGIDIFAHRGTPVLSATEGVVTGIGTNSLGGKVVWVMGPGGQRHYYAHLDDYADIKVGERVQPGMVLGKVGNTGNARGTPPHLHYGIYSNGALNPYPLLKAGAVASAKHTEKSPRGKHVG